VYNDHPTSTAVSLPPHHVYWPAACPSSWFRPGLSIMYGCPQFSRTKAAIGSPRPTTLPASVAPSIFRNKNRRRIGESQSKTTGLQGATDAAPPAAAAVGASLRSPSDSCRYLGHRHRHRHRTRAQRSQRQVSLVCRCLDLSGPFCCPPTSEHAVIMRRISLGRLCQTHFLQLRKVCSRRLPHRALPAPRCKKRLLGPRLHMGGQVCMTGCGRRWQDCS
jgi:hypothetical protein